MMTSIFSAVKKFPSLLTLLLRLFFVITLVSISPSFGLDNSLYEINGGTIAAITTKNGVVIAADRISTSPIRSDAEIDRIVQVSERTVVATCLCHTDCTEVTNILLRASKNYSNKNKRPISPSAMAFYLSSTLYQRKSSAYYAMCCVAGLDISGVPGVFHFDYVGSFERVPVLAAGLGEKYIQPILDMLYKSKRCTDTLSLWEINHESSTFESKSPIEKCLDMTVEEAETTLIECFQNARKRGGSSLGMPPVGDCIDIVTIVNSNTTNDNVESQSNNSLPALRYPLDPYVIKALPRIVRKRVSLK